MIRPGVLLFAAAGAALALTPALGATGAAPPKPRVQTVKAEVQALGMDGPIVAYGVKFLELSAAGACSTGTSRRTAGAAGLVYATPSKLVRYSLKQLQAALG